MADNSSIPVASGNETFANKDIGGVKYPKHIPTDSSGAEIVPAKETGGNLATIAGAVSGSKMATKAASGDFADGAIATFGTKADAKSTATDTTSVTAMSVWKQISASVQAVASALAGTLTVATHAVTQSGSWVLSAGTALIGKVGIDQTTDGTTNKVAADLRVAGVAIDKGKGTVGSATPRIAIASDSDGIVPTTSPGTGATAMIGVQGAASMVPLKTTPGVSATASGATASRVNSGASTNATNLKASAGQLYTVDLFNVADYTVFLKLYNKASSPTVGTDTPVMTIPIQAGGGFSKTWSFGKSFSTGISYAITKLQADSDTTAVAAGDVTGSMDWI